MKYVEVMQYCLSFPNSERRVLNRSGNAFALTVGSKPFGYFETGAPIQWQFSLQVTPQHYDELPNPPQVRQASGKPGDNWITIQRVENFDEEFLKELIDWSYQQVAQQLAC